MNNSLFLNVELNHVIRNGCRRDVRSVIRKGMRIESIIEAINNHIICQRYFHIRDFNEESVNSLEIKHLMDSICGMNLNDFGAVGIIPNHLKNKSVDFLWNTYNPYSTTTDQSTKNINDKIDDFQFEIRIDKQTVAKTMFSGNPFPPKVIYAVDIK